MSILTSGRILVTGGAGLIGSALIHALNNRGIDNILVCDILGSSEKYRNLVPLRFADYIEASDLDLIIEATPEKLADIRAVFHLGACSSTTESDCSYLIRNNYEYTKTLATWALANDSRFVYASSAATYGDGSQGMDDKSDNLQALRPLNMYGYSKHLFDLYAQRHGMLNSIVGLKYFNVFGPNEDHKENMRSVVHKAFREISESGSVSLFKSHHPDYRDGEQERDFLYVKDACEMTLHLAETPTANGIFNLGSGEAKTWLDLVRPIFAAMDKTESIQFIDMPQELRAKYQYHTCADISKLKATGYTSPFTPLSEAVTDYVQNYLMPNRTLGA